RRADLGRLAAVLGVAAAAVWGELLDGLNHAALDVLQSMQGPPAATPVGLVALDEAAYLDRDVLFEREALAGLLRGLLAGGARAVGVDVIHHRPSRAPHEGRDEPWAALAEDPRVTHVTAPLARSADARVGEERSGAALGACALDLPSVTARAPKRRRLPGESERAAVRAWQAAALRFDARSPDPARLDAPGAPVAPGELQDEGLAWVARERHARLASEPRLLLPFARLLERASGVAHVGLYPDSDGVVRHAPLLLRSGDRVFPSLGLLLAARALGAGLEHISYAQSTVTLSPPGRAPVLIPVDECARLTLRVRGEPSQRPQAPVLALIGDEGRAPPPAEVLVVSPTALAAGGWGAVSHWRHAPLSLAHLLTAENILNGDFVRVAPRRWALAWALLLCGAAFWHAQRARAGHALALVLGHAGVAAGVSLGALLGWGLQTPLVLLAALTALASLYGSTVQSGRERARRHALAQRVGEALPPRLLERLLDGEGARVDVPTRRGALGVVAASLEGLDALSDEAPPPALTQALAALREAMHALALQRGGLVVSAGRGAAMVTFKRDTAEERAREAAAFARALRAAWAGELWRWRALGAPPALGLGVEEGSASLGPLTVSRDAFYGLHGALAARAEALAREAGGQVLASERVARLLGAAEEAAGEAAGDSGPPRLSQGPAVRVGGAETRSFYLE
ncbi:MAG: CHASE2 domain-containing protein, partial [Deltaproteobacteria bacterium]|nr:CHASE2 domain-containing protein [Deltaproteobacteria bacterium]